MKKRAVWYIGLLAALCLTLVLSACTAEETTETEAVEISETEAPPETAITEEAVQPTFEPIVLEDALITESGLQFLEIIAGDGEAPIPGDIIVMDVIGTLADGSEIINSIAQGNPVVVIFGMEQLLPGWEEGVGLMKAGGQAKLVLTPELAFGEEGYGNIPPNAQVMFDVTLTSVEAPPEPLEFPVEDLVTTDSGLQYYDISIGDGTLAELNATVQTHYTLWVREEAEDMYVASSKYMEAVGFAIGRMDVVFPGWDEGTIGMQVGGKRLLIIPPELALGEQESSAMIPANSTLIMEIELMDATEPIRMTEVDESELTTTESGLQYVDFTEGEGDFPQTGQTVVVHYTGWLEDGVMFDSSVMRGEPFSFEIGTGGVIAGWDEGLASMKIGGKRQLVIPAELGYGETGAGSIPPGSTLIFEVELLDILD